MSNPIQVRIQVSELRHLDLAYSGSVEVQSPEKGIAADPKLFTVKRWVVSKRMTCMHCAAHVQEGDIRATGCNKCQCDVCPRSYRNHFIRYGKIRDDVFLPPGHPIIWAVTWYEHETKVKVYDDLGEYHPHPLSYQNLIQSNLIGWHPVKGVLERRRESESEDQNDAFDEAEASDGSTTGATVGAGSHEISDLA